MIQKDQSTLKEHLISAWNQTGVRPEQLDYEPCPEAAEYLWGWFCQLQSERQQTDMGSPQPFDSPKIVAWQQLNDVKLLAFELEAIQALDRLYLMSQQKKG